jgi:hypothetical protein
MIRRKQIGTIQVRDIDLAAGDDLQDTLGIIAPREFAAERKTRIYELLCGLIEKNDPGAVADDLLLRLLVESPEIPAGSDGPKLPIPSERKSR